MDTQMILNNSTLPQRPLRQCRKERREIGYEIFKNVIIAQNRALLKLIAKDFGRCEQRLLERYLKPEYYLPIVEKDGPN